MKDQTWFFSDKDAKMAGRWLLSTAAVDSVRASSSIKQQQQQQKKKKNEAVSFKVHGCVQLSIVVEIKAREADYYGCNEMDVPSLQRFIRVA